MKITAGDETNNGQDEELNLNDEEKWQLEQIENGKMEEKPEDDTKLPRFKIA